MDDLSRLEALQLLLQIDGLGPQRIQQLIAHFSSPEAVFNMDVGQIAFLPSSITEQIETIQAKGRAHPLWQQLLQDQQYIDEHHVHLLSQDSDLYPPLLREIDAPPPLLYVKGDPFYLSQAQLAIVGSRKVSTVIQHLSYEWSQQLAASGLVITSGLALGVDGAAHQGAVDAHSPTVAVLAHGIDETYPRQHRQLADAIIDCGALVSEFPLRTSPKREHFPRRNRIISGLSLGLLVTEAAIKSGSMISAQYAIDQGRDVFAVPSHVMNHQADGCNHLIKQGAFLVSSPEDILQELQWQRGDMTDAHMKVCSGALNQLSAAQRELLEQISFVPIHMDELIINSGKTAAELAVGLLELEVLQWVECIGGNYQRIR